MKTFLMAPLAALVAASTAPVVPAQAASSVPAEVASSAPGFHVRHLGTLGGFSSTVQAINERGQVVGSSLTADGEQHAFLWSAGVMTDLGTLGGTRSTAKAVNDRGQVIGTSEDRTGRPRAFLWERGVIRDLGTPADQPAWTVDINERGQVLGQFGADEDAPAFVWERGVITRLGALSTTYPRVWPMDLNDRGQATGYAAVGETGVQQGFLWSEGTLRSIGAPVPGMNSYPTEINNHGQIAATASVTADNTMHAARWQQGRWTDLGSLGGASQAGAINERGTVVGDSVIDDLSQATVFRAGAVIDLSERSGYTISGSTDVNNHEQVIGWGSDALGDSSTFLWQPGASRRRLPATAADLNDRGQIAATATNASGDYRAVLISIR